MTQQVALQQKALKSSVQNNNTTTKTNTSTTTTKSTVTTKNNSYASFSVKRESWPMWLLFIATGLVSGPLMAYFLVIPYIMPLVYEHIDFVIPEAVLYIAMLVIGGIVGAVISHFTQDNYETATKGAPWLLISLLVPLATFIATAFVVAAVALVVGIVYVLIVIVILAIGGAIAAACCGG